jgi:hypothetical protein
MKNYLLPFLILATSTFSAQAVQISKEQLPAKVLPHFMKKHPVTSNLVIEEKMHFGQKLYELSFTEEKTSKVLDDDEEKYKNITTKEETSVFYRKNGSFFVSAEKIYAFSVIPSIATNGLKAAFPDYKITAAKVIINPNGSGEEYEVDITSLNIPWSVSLDGKGNIISKENLAVPNDAIVPEPPVPAVAP